MRLGGWGALVGALATGVLVTGCAVLDDSVSARPPATPSSETEQFPLSYAPDQQYAGAVVLDVPSSTGTLAIDGFSRGGWEWGYPQ